MKLQWRRGPDNPRPCEDAKLPGHIFRTCKRCRSLWLKEVLTQIDNTPLDDQPPAFREDGGQVPEDIMERAEQALQTAYGAKE